MRALPAWRWPLAATALALSVGLGLSWCIVHSPLTLYDGLGPILSASRASSSIDVFRGALHGSGYFRPLRLAQIKAVFDLAPSDPTMVFKAVHVGLTLLACGLFVAVMRVRSGPQFVAAAIALMIFVGHHSFFLLMAEAYPINHFLEMLVLSLSTALLARSRYHWWNDVAAVALLIVALLTLESGVLIVVVAAVSWMTGWRGISGRAVTAGVLLLAGYFWLRIDVLGISGPALDERASGFGLVRLEPQEILARFGANPLPFYAYNVASAALTVLISQPRYGTWIFVRRWLQGDVAPWMWIHLVSSLLVTVLLVARLAPATRRWRRGTLEDGDRFVLLAVALVGANAVISYAYVKDEVLSVASTFYALGAFAVLAPLAAAHTGTRARTIACGVVLIITSLLWTSRAAGCFYSLRSFSYKTARDWAVFVLERELPGEAAMPSARQLFLALRQRALQNNVPNPRFTSERHVQRYVEIQ